MSDSSDMNDGTNWGEEISVDEAMNCLLTTIGTRVVVQARAEAQSDVVFSMVGPLEAWGEGEGPDEWPANWVLMTPGFPQPGGRLQFRRVDIQAAWKCDDAFTLLARGLWLTFAPEAQIACEHYPEQPPTTEGTGELLAVPRQFDDLARARALEVLEEPAWGDLSGQCDTVEAALRRALAATVDDFERWEFEGLEHGFDNEFALSAEEVAKLPAEWHAAYVARLLRTIALCYGIETEFGKAGGNVGTPADLLRNLTLLTLDTALRRHGSEE